MFDLTKSLADADARFKRAGRKRRTDKGSFRFDERAQAILDGLLSGYERPKTAGLLRELRTRCAELGVTAPSRATVYNYIDSAPVPRLNIEALPAEVRSVLYNLDATTPVPSHQVAFRAFNEGGLRALSYAAGLPWLALHRARRLRGWRPRGLAVIEAVCRSRGI